MKGGSQIDAMYNPDSSQSEGECMAKTTRTSTKNKAATKPPSVLKALKNIVVKPAEFDVHLKRMRETLAAKGLS